MKYILFLEWAAFCVNQMSWMCHYLFLDRKISLVSGSFGENDGGPNSAEDGLSVILVPFN